MNTLLNLCSAIWRWSPFRLNIVLLSDQFKRIFVTGSTGGCFKTTTAKAICKRYKHYHIRGDVIKYNLNWVREDESIFKSNVENSTRNAETWVYDLFYSDPSYPVQEEVSKEILNKCDLVIWNDIPCWVSLWRLSLRSLKRALGIEYTPYPESWDNIWEMLKKTYNHYDLKQQILTNAWEELKNRENRPIMLKAEWPCFYSVS